MQVKLISKTRGENGETPQEIISYCARVSNPTNQANFSSAAKLLKYCFNNGHVSIFEQATFTFEIETSRAIAAQILRHRHFCFQEFSQRYAEVNGREEYKARTQDPSNRQNSVELEDTHELNHWFQRAQDIVWDEANKQYREALRLGIAKEQARFLLPMSTKTVLYMTGTLRSWIHYLAIRTGHGTQKEHKDIACAIRDVLLFECPDVLELLTEYDIIKHNPYDGGDT